ncbi:PadR family transcriptional regulator [Streptomyces sp. NPDC059176]|uniref:PadR family transcriptional regulator n=1 Tax=unclassified Streptomyces TaxID=2593676 RepID=UPI0036B7D54D
MSLRHALLGLLEEKTASGYDLMKLFDTSLANVWPATQSQLYGELNRLSTAGLIEVAAEGPRGRKEYAITEEGSEELRRWLAEPFVPQPVRSETLLRCFFLGLLPPAEADAQLARQEEAAANRLAALEVLQTTVAWGDDVLSVNGRLVLEYGLRQSAMQRDWARWARERIAERAEG